MTASGDQRLRLWDVVGETLLTSFSGHTGSVKSVCVKKDEPSESNGLINDSRSREACSPEIIVVAELRYWQIIAVISLACN